MRSSVEQKSRRGGERQVARVEQVQVNLLERPQNKNCRWLTRDHVTDAILKAATRELKELVRH